MKRIALLLGTVVGLALASAPARASWGHCSYSGYQPWYNIFAKRYKCLTPEEARLQKFWHDYYDAMKCFYCALDHIDWVAYYKNHGYQINGGCGGPGCGCGRINYAPVFVTPTIQWAVPQSCLNGPPAVCPACYNPGCGAPGPMPGMGMAPPPGYPPMGMAPAGYPPMGMAPPPGYPQ
jgi:hypothetical protein